MLGGAVGGGSGAGDVDGGEIGVGGKGGSGGGIGDGVSVYTLLPLVAIISVGIVSGHRISEERPRFHPSVYYTSIRHCIRYIQAENDVAVLSALKSVASDFQSQILSRRL